MTRGISATWENLSGHWASEPSYGKKIIDIYQDLIITQSALNPPKNGGTTNPTPPAPTPTPTPSSPPNVPTPTPAHVPLPSDTPPDSWFTPYVQKVLDLGIMKGTDKNSNKFEPNLPATRAELAVALYNLYQALQKNQTNS